MLPKITIIHSFVAIYCQNGSKNVSLSNASRNYNYLLPECNLLSKRYEKHLTWKCFQKLQLLIALLQFIVKTVL